MKFIEVIVQTIVRMVFLVGVAFGGVKAGAYLRRKRDAKDKENHTSEVEDGRKTS